MRMRNYFAEYEYKSTDKELMYQEEESQQDKLETWRLPTLLGSGSQTPWSTAK